MKTLPKPHVNPYSAWTRPRRNRVSAVLLTLGLVVGGCASVPEERVVQRDEVSTSANAQLPPTQVYFYPTAGQTKEQQDRDRFECYLWARKQTGFDPSQPQYASRVKVEVIPSPPPGNDTALGAVSGALIGAAVSRPRDAGSGAAVGAVAGAMIGAASDAARQDQAARIQERYERRDAQSMAAIENRAADYRRAMAACLEGRGYSVQ
jgi:hypothetical protein